MARKITVTFELKVRETDDEDNSMAALNIDNGAVSVGQGEQDLLREVESWTDWELGVDSTATISGTAP